MSDSDSDDSELARAIALSLQQSSPAPAEDDKSIGTNSLEKRMIDLTDDIPKTGAGRTTAASSSGAPIVQPRANKPSQTGGLAGFDRKQMEAERLARLSKRAEGQGNAGESIKSYFMPGGAKSVKGVEDSPPRASKRRRLDGDAPSSSTSAVQELDDDAFDAGDAATRTPNKKRGKRPASARNDVIDLSSPPQSPTRLSPPRKAPTEQFTVRSTSTNDLQYPQGVIKRTWAFKHDRQNDIKIEEVLQKHTLKVAILSSFQWDWEWVSSKLSRTARIYMVMQAKDQETQDQYRKETADLPQLRLCFPPMPGQVTCMHSKLMLLFHPNHMRVVVPSANLVPYDWGDGGARGAIMENSVFLIDLPRLDDGKKQTRENLPDFGKSLLDFLKYKTLTQDVLDGVLKFDFSSTKRLAFVHTVGGTHFGNDMQGTGYFGLSKAVHQLGLQTDSSLEVDIVSASIGSLTEQFLSTIYSAAQGKGLPKDGKILPVQLKDKLRVFFPTHATVAASTGGTNGAGTICLQKKWWESPTFPKSLFHDHRSVRSGLVSHNKIIFARAKASGSDGGKPSAWVYVGSANLSESAWGKLAVDRTRKESKLNCRNWECGVLVPIPDDRIARDLELQGHDRDPGDLDEPDENELGEVGLPSMGVFEGVVDVPMEWPSEPIGNRRPWFFME